jgi:RNA polymerase sigma-70 factor (ECF subfamily)
MTINAELINACAKGERKAQEFIYKKFASAVMGVCVRYVRDRDDAHDVFQEAFIQIFQKIHTVEKPEALAGWIRRLTVNTAINFYNKNKKHSAVSGYEKVYEDDGTHHDLLAQMSAEEIMKIVDKLPDGYRMVFNLYVVEGYKHEEIAEMLNINVGTSKSQLFKAKNMLREMLQTLQIKNFEN